MKATCLIVLGQEDAARKIYTGTILLEAIFKFRLVDYIFSYDGALRMKRLVELSGEIISLERDLKEIWLKRAEYCQSMARFTRRLNLEGEDYYLKEMQESIDEALRIDPYYKEALEEKSRASQ